MSQMRIFSGVKPTGHPTLGNYLGAIRQFVELQREAECFFAVVDLHALTVPQEPAELHERTLEVARLFVACGIDPEVAAIFLQSHVAAHAELSWLLECTTYFGELRRMTQFREKSQGKANVTAGLFTYPVLMAADILLYEADRVPVGEDQKQHLELARDIALRVNNRFGPVFRVPEPYIAAKASGARIMSLDDPKRKMGKSEDPRGSILLLDPPDVVVQKIRSAVTDSGNTVRYDEEAKPAISNLMVIYSLCSGEPFEVIEERYGSKGYGAFKRHLADVVIHTLEPIQRRYADLTEPGLIEQVLEAGRQKAEPVAQKTLRRFRDRLGLVRRLAG